LDFEIQQMFQPHLGSGERLLWTGRPKQGIRLTSGDGFMIPFSLMWGGFALYWEIGVLRSGAPGAMALFGIPFVIMGIYIILGRFFVDAYGRSKTFYGLSETRVLIKSGVFKSEVKSVSIANLDEIDLSENRNGRGTITLGKSPFDSYRGFARAGWPGIKKAAMLDTIEDAAGVYKRIIDLQAQQR